MNDNAAHFAIGLVVGFPLGAACMILLTGVQMWIRVLRGEKP